jgi:hypothetical protein
MFMTTTEIICDEREMSLEEVLSHLSIDCPNCHEYQLSAEEVNKMPVLWTDEDTKWTTLDKLGRKISQIAALTKDVNVLDHVIEAKDLVNQLKSILVKEK